MQRVHYRLWERCQKLIGGLCGDRDASHGLAHMQRVTEQSILLYFMSSEVKTPNPESCFNLYGIILVAMLHDLADHKYDHNGDLNVRLHDFISREAAHWIRLCSDPVFTENVNSAQLDEVGDGFTAQRESFFSQEDAKMLLQEGIDGICDRVTCCIKAISYSTENKRGRRWYEQALPPRWQIIRNVVSDADKLEAIGEEGLLRCYAYVCERYKEQSALRQREESPLETPVAVDTLNDQVQSRKIEQKLLKDVCAHFDEKLSRLASLFIITQAGKFLAGPRHAAMVRLLEKWQQYGPPPVCLY